MNVLIADSNDIVRVGLNSILSSDSSIKIVGEATSNEEFLEVLTKESVDVAVLDYTASNFSIDVVPKALNINKHLKIVAVTTEQAPAIIIDALKSGVTSYVKKDCDLIEIQDSVKETVRGNRFFCGKILDIIRRASIDVEHLDLTGFSCAPVSLSEREMEIIKYIAEGSTNNEIAELIHLSPHTVNTHRKNVMAKLGVKNTAGIVMYAVKSNLVSPNKFFFAGNQ